MSTEYMSKSEAKKLLQERKAVLFKSESYSGGGRHGFTLHFHYTLVKAVEIDGKMNTCQRNHMDVVLGNIRANTGAELQLMCKGAANKITPSSGTSMGRYYWVSK